MFHIHELEHRAFTSDIRDFRQIVLFAPRGLYYFIPKTVTRGLMYINFLKPLNPSSQPKFR